MSQKMCWKIRKLFVLSAQNLGTWDTPALLHLTRNNQQQKCEEKWITKKKNQIVH